VTSQGLADQQVFERIQALNEDGSPSRGNSRMSEEERSLDVTVVGRLVPNFTLEATVRPFNNTRQSCTYLRWRGCELVHFRFGLGPLRGAGRLPIDHSSLLAPTG
jgi:hypothetical protein